MRASGRGGRQGPRGDRIPPRALLAFMGMCARKRPSLAFMGRLCARAPFRARGPAACGLVLRSGAPFPARGAFPRLAGFLCAECLYV